MTLEGMLSRLHDIRVAGPPRSRRRPAIPLHTGPHPARVEALDLGFTADD
jgi:hypothetical protein